MRFKNFPFAVPLLFDFEFLLYSEEKIDYLKIDCLTKRKKKKSLIAMSFNQSNHI